MDGLARFLGANPPFCSLAESDLEKVAAAARVVDHPAGALIVDAFASAGDDLFVVMAGQVELWTTDGSADEPADEIVGQGCVFGHTTALTGAPIGPRAVALGPVRLVEIPRTAVAAAFSSPEGVRFLAQDLAEDRVRAAAPARFRTVDDLVVSAPVLGHADMTVAEAARVMTERSSRYLAVPRGNGEFGLITDGVLRERVLAAGRPTPRCRR